MRPRRRSCWSARPPPTWAACATAMRCRCRACARSPLRSESMCCVFGWRSGRRAALDGALDRGAAADFRRAGRSPAGDRVGRSRIAALSAASVPDGGSTRRAFEGTRHWRAARGIASRSGTAAGRIVLGGAKRRHRSRSACRSASMVRRRDGGETLKPAANAATRRPCSTCVSRKACCRGCAKRCRWCLPAMT